MTRRNNTPEYWMSLVEQHLALGNKFALIPIDSFPPEAAVALAERLDVKLERWDTDYIFQQKVQVELKEGQGRMH
jgi:hypothetical protein